MPMTTLTRWLPKMLVATVGVQEKKPPLEMPLRMQKMASGASDCETGQMTSMLKADRSSELRSTLTGPNLSQQKPQMMRPMADDRVKPATRPAPVLEEKPRAWL